MNLSPAFVRTVTATFALAGESWLQQLPSLLAEYEERWSLALHDSFPNLSYNYVAPVTLADGAHAVLKAGVPRSELLREIAALRLYAGQGSARLLQADEEAGVMLLERIYPGATLAQLEDDARATAVLADMMARLWRALPADHPFLSVEAWADGLVDLRARFDGGSGPLPLRLVELAERLFADLFDSAAAPVLLHGDLHHENILASAGSGWLAIDPKGMTGEPAYDVGPLFWNPANVCAWPNLEQVQARRVAILCDRLGLERQRVAAWAVAQAVLSAWWTIEDNGTEWQAPIRIAESLLPLLGEWA